MLKLRRDLNRAVTLLEMVRRREKSKQDKLELTATIFRRRYTEGDWEGRVVADALQKRAREQQRAFQNLAWMNQLTPAATVAAAAAAAAAAQQGMAYMGGASDGAASAASASKHKRQHAKKKSKSREAIQ